MRFITSLRPCVLLLLYVGTCALPANTLPLYPKRVIPANQIDLNFLPGRAREPGRTLAELPKVDEVTYMLLPTKVDPEDFQARLRRKGITEDHVHDWFIEFVNRAFMMMGVTAQLQHNSPKFHSRTNYWKLRITTPDLFVVKHGKPTAQDEPPDWHWDVVSSSSSLQSTTAAVFPLSTAQVFVSQIIPCPCEVQMSMVQNLFYKTPVAILRFYHIDSNLGRHEDHGAEFVLPLDDEDEQMRALFM
ncbi:hypothetical protein FB446DRAFT_746691 [Lentinula raphanica]|nr:hypothetical protein FB446DRAFT_746691 [Lentinula raphanica]